MCEWFNRLFVLALANMICAVAISYAGAAIGADGSECRTRSSSDNVVVVVCPPGLKPEAWKTAGVAACVLDFGTCNAWIWDDVKLAPQTAPDNDVELSESQILNAVAIWDNEKQLLVVLKQIGQ